MSHQRARTAALDDLLAAYRPGSAFLASGRGVLLGRGAAARTDRLADVGDLLRATTTEAPEVPDGPAAPAASRAPGGVPRGPLALGAIPFAPGAPARIVVPEEVVWAPPLSEAPPGDRGRGPLPGPWTMRAVPEPAAHVAGVERALKLMADAGEGELAKVVLARSLRLTGPGPVDVARLLRNLAWRDPAGFTFAMDLPTAGEGPRTLVGASPELLVAKRGGAVVSNPLAGSAPRSADPSKDQRRAVELLGSAKDRHEHAVVVEAVAEALRPYCRTLRVPEPELAGTATLWHLSTRITGELRDTDTPSAVLAAALHPTPAVCGTPTAAARAAIAAIEPFDRGFYTGAVGYTDAAGDGEWVVSIRCAEVSGDSLDLFAGGGILPGSDPDAELAETSAKLRTLLLALGVNQPPPGTG
ncbi:isochorismate synthase [Streptomonospora nanhaiensis]|uniref:isochorismate synthase n=1 Tax=Streptomonospora nanhaiensis TaxID=1323731 RepID=UPI001C9A27E1|nr:isochorismate synthase [Streptomonospora nanhaiensis]MBX9388543.1 isochorismate synthase [Streptomonospora nanhaiensis]